ncbi:unnamed protein product, partial [Adineta steineri]
MPSNWFLEFKTKIKHINLFKDIDETNEEDIKNQKYPQLSFLFLVEQPSLSDYKQLEEKYSNTLLCPCTSVSNEYNKFISSFTPTFNQVCLSDFVSDEWLNYVNYRLFLEPQYHFYWDFRHLAYGFFAMLRTLCVLAKQTIDDELISFYSTILLTENTISEDIFLANINAIRDQFKNASAHDFIITLDSIILMGLVSDVVINRLETNWKLVLFSSSNNTFFTGWANLLYTLDENCVHPTSVYCSTTSGIYFRKLSNETSSNLTWAKYRAELQFEVPGVLVGPFILTAVLQSNLACLYNESCLSNLNTYLNDSLSPFNATSLTMPPSASPFPTINDLAEKLMVDSWQLNSSYQHYFNACHPLTCTYTYSHQFDVLFIITTVISFIGGIVTVLMIVILPTVTFLRKKVKNFKRLLSSSLEVVPHETNIERHAVGDITEQQISLFVKIKMFLLNLNFFLDSDENSEWHSYGQRLSTRFFIISLIIAFFILILYASTYSVTKTITINKPSIDLYFTLQDKYPQTLTCPCSSTTNEHSQFISFQPTFHPVCHSDFVTTNWSNYLIAINGDGIYYLDFRYTNSAFFPTISSFCQISLKTINNEIFIFNSTKYVTKSVQEIDLFNSQTQQLISDMKQTTANLFPLSISMLRQTVWGNVLFSVLTYNYIPDPPNDYDYNSATNPHDLDLVFYPVYYQSSNNTNCSCKIHPTTCNVLSSITYVNHTTETYKNLFTVPGFYTGCYASEATFRSNFECFFNQTCLQTIYNLTYLRSKHPFYATAMQLNSSHYDVTTSVEDIIDNLMVEEWNNETSFQFYYKQCNPYLCSYSYDVKGDISYVIAVTFGLIGGLTTILKIIIPSIVLMIRRWRQKRRIGINQPIMNQDIQTTTTGQKLKISILTFNLFKNRNKRSEEQLQQQRFSTRLFFIITLITLIILVFYVSFQNITHTIIKNKPTIIEFNKLYQEYPNTIQCPCQTYSITYEQFITFQPHLHSTCSSTFVDETSLWLIIDYPQAMLSGNNGAPTYSTRKDDFRQIGSPFFQLLNSFCNLSSKTMNAELTTFYSSRFITLNLITFEQFQIQINQLINQFIKNTARSFINSLFFAENMTTANMFFSASQSDSLLSSGSPLYEYDNYLDYQYIYDRTDQVYNSNETGIDCDCQSTPWCIQQAIIYDLDTTTQLFSPPGIFVGCYLVEAVLQSDLRCFFDIDCLQQLIDSLSLVNISASDIILNSTASHYQEKSSLLEIVSNLMVEEWNNQTFYDNYFNICQPSVCTATYISRGNIIYIITTTIGLIGGLTKVYKFIVPIFIKITVRVIIPFLRKKCDSYEYVEIMNENYTNILYNLKDEFILKQDTQDIIIDASGATESSSSLDSTISVTLSSIETDAIFTAPITTLAMATDTTEPTSTTTSTTRATATETTEPTTTTTTTTTTTETASDTITTTTTTTTPTNITDATTTETTSDTITSATTNTSSSLPQLYLQLLHLQLPQLTSTTIPIVCNDITEVEYPNNTCISKSEAQRNTYGLLKNNTGTSVEKAGNLSLYFSSIARPNAEIDGNYVLNPNDINGIVKNLTDIKDPINSTASLIVLRSFDGNRSNTNFGASFLHGVGGRTVENINDSQISRMDMSIAGIATNIDSDNIKSLNILIIDDPFTYENFSTSSTKRLASSVVVMTAVQKSAFRSLVPMNIDLYFNDHSHEGSKIIETYKCGYYNTTALAWNEIGCSERNFNSNSKGY